MYCLYTNQKEAKIEFNPYLNTLNLNHSRQLKYIFEENNN